MNNYTSLEIRRATLMDKVSEFRKQMLPSVLATASNRFGAPSWSNWENWVNWVNWANWLNNAPQVR